FYCAQLAFVPLVLGPVMSRTSAGFATVSARWALVILGVSAVMGLLAVTIYVATRNESWLWAAVPACLGSGFVLFVMARQWPGKPPAAPEVGAELSRAMVRGKGAPEARVRFAARQGPPARAQARPRRRCARMHACSQ